MKINKNREAVCSTDFSRRLLNAFRHGLILAFFTLLLTGGCLGNKKPEAKFWKDNVTIEAIDCLDYGDLQNSLSLRKFQVKDTKTGETFILETQRNLYPKQQIKVRQMIYSAEKNLYFENAFIHSIWDDGEGKKYQRTWEEFKQATQNPDVPQKADKRIYIMQSGDTLWKLGSQFYGNRHFDKIIALHNNIADPKKIPINTEIQVPKLEILLAEEGLTKTSAKEIKQILQARELFIKHEKQIAQLRERQQPLAKPIKQDLRIAAENIDQAIKGLGTKKPGVKKIPKYMIRQLKNLSIILHSLAQGSNDGYGYDQDMVHQRLIHALLNGIKWARNDFE